MQQEGTPLNKRIVALDYLRGFFIAVIIIDHFWRWPNLFQFVTGRGELWVSAAEGFILISGLLVGYVHGFKKRKKPLFPLSRRLIERGIMLYIWMWITTLILVYVTWNFAPKGGMAYIPVPVGDWHALFSLMLSFNYAHSLTHFLYLYAIYLVVSPSVIWLLRKNLWWIVIALSIIAYFVGMQQNIEYLQWQILFFVASVIGYHFDSMLARLRRLPANWRHLLRVTAIVGLISTFVYSMTLVFAHEPGSYTDPTFTRRPLSWPTIPMALLWFAGLLSLFTYLTPLLERFGRWLLTFGERSLTAYIVHIIPLTIVQLLIAPTTGSFWLNTLLSATCVAATWVILKIPGINRVIPR